MCIAIPGPADVVRLHSAAARGLPLPSFVVMINAKKAEVFDLVQNVASSKGDAVEEDDVDDADGA